MSEASQQRIHRLETQLALDKEQLQALEENEKALYEQRNYTSNAADRNNLDRQIEALREDIEKALARCEATERELAAAKGSTVPSQAPMPIHQPIRQHQATPTFSMPL